jgi:hypothetical protein
MLVEEKWKSIINAKDRWNEEHWIQRENFRHGISWHIPSQELLDSLLAISPSLSVGAGLGYTEKLAIEKGGDLIVTDIEPSRNNNWCQGEFHCEVEKLSALEAIKKYPERNVFMAWPPYDHPMAYEVATAMLPGKLLLYVGESGGGCNGDDKFFGYLYENFEIVEDDISIPSWSGIYDSAVLYRKNV